MGRPRSWSDEQLIQAVAGAPSWRAILREIGIPVSSAAIRRVKGHALRLGLDVKHLGGAPAVVPIASPAPLDTPQVVTAVTSSAHWVEAIEKLGLAKTSRNYKRVQAVAGAAGAELRGNVRACTGVGYVPPATPTPPPPTVRKGTRSEGAILSALIGAGYNVLIPFGVARYDLVIETADGFRRVQCKTARLAASECMTFNVNSSSPEGVRRNYSGEIDYFGVFLPETGDVYLIPISEVEGYRHTPHFRLAQADTASGGVHYAAPYRLVAQQDRALVS